MAITVKRGYASKAYRNSATFATPTWNEIGMVGDASVNLVFDEAEASQRGDGVKASEPTLLGIEFTGRVRSDENSDDYTAIETAFFTRAMMDIMALDGGNAVNGSRGVRYEGKFSQWSEDQSLGNILFREFTHKPCLSEQARQSVIVTAGAPVFTAI